MPTLSRWSVTAILSLFLVVILACAVGPVRAQVIQFTRTLVGFSTTDLDPNGNQQTVSEGNPLPTADATAAALLEQIRDGAGSQPEGETYTVEVINPPDPGDTWNVNVVNQPEPEPDPRPTVPNTWTRYTLPTAQKTCIPLGEHPEWRYDFESDGLAYYAEGTACECEPDPDAVYPCPITAEFVSLSVQPGLAVDVTQDWNWEANNLDSAELFLRDTVGVLHQVGSSQGDQGGRLDGPFVIFHDPETVPAGPDYWLDQIALPPYQPSWYCVLGETSYVLGWFQPESDHTGLTARIGGHDYTITEHLDARLALSPIGEAPAEPTEQSAEIWDGETLIDTAPLDAFAGGNVAFPCSEEMWTFCDTPPLEPLEGSYLRDSVGEATAIIGCQPSLWTVSEYEPVGEVYLFAPVAEGQFASTSTDTVVRSDGGQFSGGLEGNAVFMGGEAYTITASTGDTLSIEPGEAGPAEGEGAIYESELDLTEGGIGAGRLRPGQWAPRATLDGGYLIVQPTEPGVLRIQRGTGLPQINAPCPAFAPAAEPVVE